MTHPTDPPQPPHDIDDDAVGFVTPHSLRPAPPPPLPGARAHAEPEAFPHAGDDLTAPPLGDDPTFPANETFDPQRASDLPASPPAPPPEPDEPPIGLAGATRPFQRAPLGRALGNADEGIRQLGGERIAIANYACLIGAIATGGAAIVIALFLAHRSRRTAEGWVKSHIEYQWKTAVVGVVAVIAGLATLPIGIGVFILTVAIVWLMIRGVTGLLKFLKRQPLGATPLWSLA